MVLGIVRHAPPSSPPRKAKYRTADRTIDWWTLGVLLYEMLVGLPPFYDGAFPATSGITHLFSRAVFLMPALKYPPFVPSFSLFQKSPTRCTKRSCAIRSSSQTKSSPAHDRS